MLSFLLSMIVLSTLFVLLTVGCLLREFFNRAESRGKLNELSDIVIDAILRKAREVFGDKDKDDTKL